LPFSGGIVLFPNQHIREIGNIEQTVVEKEFNCRELLFFFKFKLHTKNLLVFLYFLLIAFRPDGNAIQNRLFSFTYMGMLTYPGTVRLPDKFGFFPLIIVQVFQLWMLLPTLLQSLCQPNDKEEKSMQDGGLRRSANNLKGAMWITLLCIKRKMLKLKSRAELEKNKVP
jgi:hypothetical protein